LAHGKIRYHLRDQSLLESKQHLVSQLGLTDFSIWTEARYTRHPSQTDFFSAFQDHWSFVSTISGSQGAADFRIRSLGCAILGYCDGYDPAYLVVHKQGGDTNNYMDRYLADFFHAGCSDHNDHFYFQIYGLEFWRCGINDFRK